MLDDLSLGDLFYEEQNVNSQLLESARETVDGLVQWRLEQHVNRLLVRCIRTRIDPAKTPYAPQLRGVAEKSRDRLLEVIKEDLTEESLAKEEDRIRRELLHSLETDDWRTSFRGRDVLQRFSNKVNAGIPYMKLRNMIVSRMRADGYKPEGMRRVIDKILLA